MISNNNNENDLHNFELDKFPQRQLGQEYYQRTRTVPQYLDYNDSTYPKAIQSFPYFIGEGSYNGLPMFLDGDEPRGSKEYAFIQDVNITTTNPVGIIFCMEAWSPNIAIIDLSNNTILQTYSIYANASSSYAAIKPVISMCSVKQEAIMQVNDNIGTILDGIVVPPNFCVPISGNNPMMVQIPLECKEGDVDGRTGISLSLLSTPFAGKLNNISSSTQSISDTRMFPIGISPISTFIKGFTGIIFYGLTSMTANLSYAIPGSSTVAVGGCSIVANQYVYVSYPLPVNTITTTGSGFMFISEVSDDTTIGYVRVSASTAARTFRISVRVACQTYPREDKMQDIPMTIPQDVVPFEYLSTTMRKARSLVAPSHEMRGRASVWSDLLIAGWNFIKPTLYTLGIKLLTNYVKPKVERSDNYQSKSSSSSPLVRRGYAMLKNNNDVPKSDSGSGNYLKLFCVEGCPIISNAPLIQDPDDGSVIVLIPKNKINDYIKSLMLVNNFNYAYIHPIEQDDFFNKSGLKGYAMMSNKARTVNMQSSASKVNTTKNPYLAGLARAGIQLGVRDTAMERSTRIGKRKGATLKLPSYQFFPVVVKDGNIYKYTVKAMIIMSEVPIKDSKLYSPLTLACADGTALAGYLDNSFAGLSDDKDMTTVYQKVVSKAAADLKGLWFAASIQCGYNSSSYMKTPHFTFICDVPFEDDSWQLAMYCLLHGAPSGQYISGGVTYENRDENYNNYDLDPHLTVFPISEEDVLKWKMGTAQANFPLIIAANIEDVAKTGIGFNPGTMFVHQANMVQKRNVIVCEDLTTAFVVASFPLSFKNYAPFFDAVSYDESYIVEKINKMPDYIKAILPHDPSSTIQLLTLIYRVIKKEAINMSADELKAAVLQLESINESTYVIVQRIGSFIANIPALMKFCLLDKEHELYSVGEALYAIKIKFGNTYVWKGTKVSGAVGAAFRKYKTLLQEKRITVEDNTKSAKDLSIAIKGDVLRATETIMRKVEEQYLTAIEGKRKGQNMQTMETNKDNVNYIMRALNEGEEYIDSINYNKVSQKPKKVLVNKPIYTPKEDIYSNVGVDNDYGQPFDMPNKQYEDINENINDYDNEIEEEVDTNMEKMQREVKNVVNNQEMYQDRDFPYNPENLPNNWSDIFCFLITKGNSTSGVRITNVISTQQWMQSAFGCTRINSKYITQYDDYMRSNIVYHAMKYSIQTYGAGKKVRFFHKVYEAPVPSFKINSKKTVDKEIIKKAKNFYDDEEDLDYNRGGKKKENKSEMDKLFGF